MRVLFLVLLTGLLCGCGLSNEEIIKQVHICEAAGLTVGMTGTIFGDVLAVHCWPKQNPEPR